MIRKIHKAAVGAMLLCGTMMVPFKARNKTFYCLPTLVPPEDDVVLMFSIASVKSPIYLPEQKVAEMVALDLVALQPDGSLTLTPHGRSVAQETSRDWHAYWDGHFTSRGSGSRPFNWKQYFQTGCYDLTA